MSWLRIIFSSNFLYNRTFICNYHCKDIRLIQRKQFSSLNKAHMNQVSVFKYRRIGECSFSVLEAVNNIQPTLRTFWKQFSKNWTAYIPLYGSIIYKQQGYFWYKTLDEINFEDFITFFNMEDTFFSRFNIVELHVWMLLFNLPKEGKINALVKYGIIEAMWKDSEDRGKMIDKTNVGYKKDFRKLNNKFQVALFLYDFGYLKNDAVLSSALWYNIFGKSPVDPRILELLVEYVRHQMHNLSKLNFDVLGPIEHKKGIWSSVDSLKHL